MQYGDWRRVRAGVTYRVDGTPALCRHGLHASKHVFDALRYAPGPMLARVELSGEVIRGTDKACASARTELTRRVDVSAELHEFACMCAERTLSRLENPDPRSVAAIEAKRAWLRGDISDSELAAAREAAWYAATSNAARYAVWYSSWAATSGASWAAAVDAALAAGAAEIKWQRRTLATMLNKALRERG